MTRVLVVVTALLLAACGGPPAPTPEAMESQATLSSPGATRTMLTTHSVEDLNRDQDHLPEPDWLLMFTDPDPVVRQVAIDMIVDARNLDKTGWLELALSDPHGGVREAAAEALEELGIRHVHEDQ